MTVKYGTAVLFLTLFFSARAQQDMLTTMFWNNYTVFNPAASGLFYKHQGNVIYRNQWDKVNGAPNTITATYNAKLKFIHGGIGVNYIHDAIGFASQQRANVNYSYHFQLGEHGTLAAGISAGLMRYAMDGVWIPPTTVNDPTLPTASTGYGLTMNFGLIYKTNKLTVGLSSTNINEPTIQNVYYSPARHYYLNADYLFELASGFDLKPQVLVRTDMVKISADLNLLVYYKKQYWAGLTYRTSDAISIMAGWDIKQKLRIGYSYDLTINQLASISRGTHEIVLGFQLK